MYWNYHQHNYAHKSRANPVMDAKIEKSKTFVAHRTTQQTNKQTLRFRTTFWIQFGLMLFRILWNKLFFPAFQSPQFQRLPYNFRVWLLHHTEKYTAYVCVCLLIKIKARTLNRLISHRHKWNYSKWLIFSWCTFDLFASLSHSVCIL